MSQKDMLNRINELQASYSVSALVPLGSGPVPGYTWEYMQKAYEARREIEDLVRRLHNREY
jgi:hypothetical protein